MTKAVQPGNSESLKVKGKNVKVEALRGGLFYSQAGTLVLRWAVRDPPLQK
jgi:hypothetical protein